ncbi:MAG: hypothetical protein SGPRY_001161 [Prymnesium sp.]
MSVGLSYAPPRAPPTIRFMALGDSITDGGTKHRAYRYHLHKLLSKTHHRFQWVGSMQGIYDLHKGRNATTGRCLRWEDDWPLEAQRHEGHWGWTARQVLHGHQRQPQRGMLTTWLKQAKRSQSVPHVAMVHLGTNDLTKHVMKEEEDVGQLVRLMREILGRLCRARAQMLLLVASPIPYCRFQTAEQRERRRQLEIEFSHGLLVMTSRRILSCRPKRVLFLNMSKAVRCEHLAGVDGVHPTAFVAMQMARQWLRCDEHVKAVNQPLPVSGGQCGESVLAVYQGARAVVT